MTAIKADLRAKDIMTREPVCVDPGMSIRALARILEENEVSGAPVVDSGGTLIGVVSKSDLIRRCTEGDGDVPPAYLFEILREHNTDAEIPEVMAEPLICVADFMTEDPVTATPDTPVGDLARMMYEGHFHRVVVVDDANFPVGIVTSMDLLNVFPR